jgi:hemerythrin-like domain-containing protein
MSSVRSKPDLLFVNLIHRSLRVDAERLGRTVAALDQDDRSSRLPGIRTFFDRYREQLVLHQTHEDTLFFPDLAARVGADGMHLSELADQHERLDADLQIVGDGLTALADPDGEFDANRVKASSAVSVMADHLAAHLALEEEAALPRFEAEVPIADYKRLEIKARQATPHRQAQFMIPWLISHATPDQRNALFRSAPPLRLMYRLNRRRYRRIDQVLVPAAELFKGK